MNLISQINEHKSIRQFKDKKVDGSTLERIIECASLAPTAGNLQSYCIILTKDKKRRHELYSIHLKQDMFLEAPIALTFCVDVSRNTKWCELRNAKPGFMNFMFFLFGMADAFLASQNACIAAESLGLGCCHSGATLFKAINLVEYFECPKGVIPVTTLVLGYPNEIPVKRTRLPMDAIIHDEKYKCLNDDEIARIYADREKKDWDFYSSIESMISSFKTKNIENLAQVYTEIKYTGENNKLFSENYLEALRKQGFLE